jgi:putative membrane protein
LGQDDEDKNVVGRQLVYFAAERTLMAWLRVSLGLMALGFVIDRFGLFLRKAMPQIGPEIYSKNFSFWAGTVLVGSGSLMAAVAAVRYLRIFLDYQKDGRINPRSGILLAVISALTMVIFGIIISVFLFLATD